MTLTKLRRTSYVALFLGLIWVASSATDFSLWRAITAIPEVVMWLINNMVPTASALEKLPRIIDKLVETILMSIMASMTAAVFSFIFAIMGAKTTGHNQFLAGISRIAASLGRNIPVAAWAMIFLLSFGQSSFTGFLALFFASFGFLTRAFMDSIDANADLTAEALRATGASYSHVISQAVVPGSLPQMLSWVLFVIETNIRSATLVGLLTGSGIGFMFSVYYKSLQYSSAALVIIAIVAVVLSIEIISNTLRRIIL